MKLNNIDLNKLFVFTEVARMGGITKAAEKLALTPSAVSQSISGLENLLDVTLFDRVGRRLLLSPRGQILFQSFERYQEGLLESLTRIKDQSKTMKGQVRIGVFHGFSNHVLAEFLSHFHSELPNIEIEVIFGAPSLLDRLLGYRHIDLAVNLFQSKSEKKLVDTLLLNDELWLVSSQKPPRRPLDMNELRKAPFIDYYRRSRLVSLWISHHFGKTVKDIPVVMYASHSAMAMQLILKGLGIGVVASSIAKPYVDSGQLFIVRGRKQQLLSPVWLKHNASDKNNPVTEVLRRKMLDYFSTVTL